MGGTMEDEAAPIVNATAVHGYTGIDANENAMAATAIAVHSQDESLPLVNVILETDTNKDEDGMAPQWRDVPFAILFWVHFGVMVWLGIDKAPKGFDAIHVNLDTIEKEMRKSDDITEKDIAEFESFLNSVAAYARVYPARIFSCLVLPTIVLAFCFGLAGTNIILKPCPRTMIYLCLISSFVWTAIILLGSAIASGSIFLYITSGIALFAVAYYVRIAWRMVPFAAVNLKIALVGIGRNCGIFFVAFCFAVIGFVWVLYWFFVSTGTIVFQYNKCKVEHPNANFDVNSDDYSDICDPSGWLVVFFLLSLYWTSTIIMNTMQVSVAGLMATWCIDPVNADSCCSNAIFGSLYRSMTFSFGSICLGSLLQAIVAVLRYLIESARQQQRENPDSGACGNIILCILDCIAGLLEDLLRAFNQWAFVFVGLYGFSYVESGKRVMELFVSKGFTAIITDNLVDYVLGFATFMVGLASALTAWFLEHSISQRFGDSIHELGLHAEPPGPHHDLIGPPPPPPPPHLLEHPLDPPPPQPILDEGGPHSPEHGSFIFGPLPHAGVFAAMIGFVIGLWVASVMMNVIKGAVNTLIVCWADAPAAMEAQHPDLSRELATTWRNTFLAVAPNPGGGSAGDTLIV